MSTQQSLSGREALARFLEADPQLNSIDKVLTQYSLANQGEKRFVEAFSSKLDGGAREARKIYRTAANIQQKASLLWANLRDVLSPYLNQTLFNTIPRQLPEAFLDNQINIPNYERLFESLDFIDCEHYRSIFGPAAYFVDLMRFIENEITNDLSNDFAAGLSLPERRPDLFAVRLDQANTNQLISYIDIVIQLLEVFAQTINGVDDDIYQTLAAAVFPPQLPFNRPLAEIRCYLEQLDSSLHQLYRTVAAPLELSPIAQQEFRTSERVTREFLGLSPREYGLISRPLTSDEVAAGYGQGQTIASLEELQAVESFLAQTGLSRSELNQLVYQDLDRHEFNAGLSRLFFINAVADGLGPIRIQQQETIDDQGRLAIQERLVNLSALKLERIYRLVRLARRLGWSFQELDQGLRSLHTARVPEGTLLLDGINDYVACRGAQRVERTPEGSRPLTLGTEATVEAWIRPERGGRQGILGLLTYQANPTGEAVPQAHFSLQINGDGRLSLRLQRFDEAAAVAKQVDIDGTSLIAVEEFTHVAVTWENQTVRFYLNGSLDQQQAVSAALGAIGDELSVATDVVIGRDLYALPFAGSIKEVRLWGYAWDAVAIAQNRYQRFSGLEPLLLGYWPLTLTPEHALLDLTPNQNHGILGGEEFVTQPVWVNRDLVLDPLPEPRQDLGFRFNGVDQYLAARPVSYGRTGLLTLETWIQPEGDGGDFYVVSKGSLGSTAQLALWVQVAPGATSGTLHFASASLPETYTSQSSLPLGRLTHVAVVLAGQRLELYLNGSLDQAFDLGRSFELDLLSPNQAPTDLQVGRSLDGQYFRGVVQEVRLWNQPRSAHEIGLNLYRPIPAGVPGLIGYWCFNSSQGDRVVDRSGDHDLYLGGIPQDYQPDSRLDTEAEQEQLVPNPVAVTGNAIELDGENDVLVIQNPRNWGLGRYERMTLEFWFKPAQVATEDPQLLFSQGDLEAGLSIYLQRGSLHVLSWNNSFEADDFQSAVLTSSDIQVDRWHHIAVVNNEFPPSAPPNTPPLPLKQVEFQAYLDGNPLQPEPVAGFCLSPVGAFFLGGLGEGATTRFQDAYAQVDQRHRYYFAGQVADLRLWHRVKTREEIQRERLIAPTITAELIAYLPMDEAEGWLVRDRAGGAHGNPHNGLLQQRNIALVSTRSDAELVNVYSHYAAPEALGWSNYVFAGRLRMTEPNQAIGVTVLSQYPNGIDQHYSLRRDAAQPAFHWVAHPLGVQTLQGQTLSGVVPEVNVWYHFQIQVEDTGNQTTLRAKLWPEGSPEPDTYDLTVYDDNPDIRITAGTVGLWTSGASPGVEQYDSLRVWPAQVNNPGPRDYWLDTTFEAPSQVPEPDQWQDTGDRLQPVPPDSLFQYLPVVGTTTSDGAPLQALGTHSTQPNIHAHYYPSDTAEDALAWGNYTFAGSMRLTESAGGIGVTVLSRYPDGVDQYYSLRRDAEHPTFYLTAEPQIQPVRSTDASQDGTDSGVSPAVNTWYFFRIRVADEGTRTRIQAKVWAENTLEPEQFQIDAYDDSSIRITAGTVGIWASGAGSKYFNELRVLQRPLLSENFEAYGPGSNPSGWQDTASNRPDRIDDSLFVTAEVANQLDLTTPVNPSDRTMVLSTRSEDINIHSHYQPEGVDVLGWSNYVFSGRFAIANANGGVGVTFFSRYPEEGSAGAPRQQDNYYRLRAIGERNNLTRFHFSLHRDGDSVNPHTQNVSYIEGQSESRVRIAPDRWYRFRIEAEQRLNQTWIRAKIWESDQPEPTNFAIQVIDTDATFTSGTVGVWSSRDGAKYFDDFSVIQAIFLAHQPQLSDWIERGSRQRFWRDDTLFRTVDIADNQLRWVQTEDYPVLLRPLGRTALQFDGQREYLAGIVTPPLSWEQLTLEAWIQRGTTTGPWLSLSQEGADGVSALGFGIADDGVLTLIHSQPGRTDTAIAGTEVVPPQGYAHVAVRIQPPQVSFFINGRPEVIDAALENALLEMVEQIEVGRYQGSRYGAGVIKEVRIWRRGLTDAEIARERFQQPLITEDLVGYWRLGEAAGAEEIDRSAGQIRLRPGGLLGARHPSLADLGGGELDFFGSHRRSLRFDGSPSQVIGVAADGEAEVRPRRTVEVWFWVNDKNLSNQKQVIYHEGDDQRGLILYIFDGALYFGGYNLPESQWQGTWLSTERVRSQRWHHAALVLDGRGEVRPGSLQAYLDGKLVAVGEGSQLWQHRPAFTIGGVETTARFHDGLLEQPVTQTLRGQVLELRLWNTIRTLEQLATHRYLQPHQPEAASILTSPALALWWFLDATTAESLADLAGQVSAMPVNTEQIGSLAPFLTPALPILQLDSGILSRIADIARLRNRHRLSVESATALWHPLPHTGRADEPALFDRIYNAGDRQPVWAYHLDQPIRWVRRSDGTAAGDRAASLSENRQTQARLMAALGLSAEALNQLVDWLSGQTETVIELDSAYLSQLYQLSQLARVLRFSVNDFQRLLGFTHQQLPLTFEAVLDLSNFASWMQQRGLSIDDLDFFRRPPHQLITESPIAFYTPEALRSTATDLTDSAGDILATAEHFRSEILSDGEAEDVLAYLRRDGINLLRSIPGAEGLAVTVAYQPDYDFTELLNYLGQRHSWLTRFSSLQAEFNQLQRGLGDTLLSQLQAQGLINTNGVVLGDDFGDEVMRGLLESLNSRRSPSVQERMSRVAQVLEQQRSLQLSILSQDGPVHTALQRIRDDQHNGVFNALADLFQVEPDLVAVGFDYLRQNRSEQDTAYLLAQFGLTAAGSLPPDLALYLATFSKLVHLQQTLELSLEEMAILLANPQAWLQRVAAARAGTILQPSLEAIDGLFRFKDLQTTFEDETHQLLAILNPAAAEQDLSALEVQVANLTGWDLAQLEALRSTFDIADYRYVPVLSRLQDIFALAQTLGVSVEGLLELADTQALAGDQAFEFYTRQAEQLLDVLRSHYTTEAWPKVYAPIRDKLAVQQRDALLGLSLLKIPAPPEPNQQRTADLLYEYFLLDVQVGAEVQTSWIVQATASLQLYVQRCLMNLEPGVSPSSVPAQQWEWMKNYRVWEANRKVFLYPENFIEPELRDTKSPLFQELEQELMQNSINQDTVTAAYTHYLDKFARIANLKMVGSYFDTDSPDDPNDDEIRSGTLYVVGRTVREPHEYYYRTQKIYPSGRRVWAPWQSIDLTINSRFVTPVYAFNRLFLFWAEFTETTRAEELQVSAGTYQRYLSYIVNRAFLDSSDQDSRNSARFHQRRFFSALERELTTEQVQNFRDNRWGINGNRYVYNLNSEAVVSINVEIFQPMIKYAYYNVFNQAWTQPQTYAEIDQELRQIEQVRPEWQRVYAQHAMQLLEGNQPATAAPEPERNAQVLEIRNTQFVQQSVALRNTNQLTFAVWVKFFGPPPTAPEPDDIDANPWTLFSYGELLATARYRVAPIPGLDGAVALSAAVSGAAGHASAVAAVAQQAIGQDVVVQNHPAVQEARQQITRIQNSINALAPRFSSIVDEAVSIVRNLGAVINLATQTAAADNDSDQARAQAREANTTASNTQFLIDSFNQAYAAIHKYEAVEVNLRFELNQQTADLPVPLNALDRRSQDQWSYITAELTYDTDSDGDQSGYQLRLYRNNAADPAVTAMLVSARLPVRSLLTVGSSLSANRPVFTVRLSDLCLLEQTLPSQDRADFSQRRKQIWEASAYLPLNQPVQGAVVQLAASGLTFNPAQQDSTRQITSEEQQEERILVFYGNRVRALRNTLLDEQKYTFELTRQSTRGRANYDLDLSSSRLHVALSDGLSLNDYAANGQSTLNRFTPDQFRIWRRQIVNFRDIYLGFPLFQNILAVQQNVLRALVHRAEQRFAVDNYLLNGLSSAEATLVDVGNRPGWYLLDTGSEQFLIRTEAETLTISERLRFNSTAPSDFGVQPVSFYFEEDPLLQANGDSPPPFRFTFERLSTFAVHELSEVLFEGGIDGLLSLRSQSTREFAFDRYAPNLGNGSGSGLVITDELSPTIDFEGAYGLYYQEIFFHIPFFIANQLNANQSFAEAQQWYHYIFNPTTRTGTGDPRSQYWQYRPFRRPEGQTFEQMLSEAIALFDTDPEQKTDAFEAYCNDPFDPHAIARLRLNAYPKAVVMKYIDNLLDWGDTLFRQDTRESINEAMLLYILAYNLLGPRPTGAEIRELAEIGTYSDFIAAHEEGAAFLTGFEAHLASSGTSQNGGIRPSSDRDRMPLSPFSNLITSFCIPENERFIGFWDRVEDRIFKIRHSQNIEGVFRQLALFDPPIDPAALVQAVARGGGISGALSQLNVAVPHYRYGYVLDLAKDMIGNAIELGSALLDAIEKRDAEQLAVLQNTHEQQLLDLITFVKEREREQAIEAAAALRITERSLQTRRDRFQRLVDGGLSPSEIFELVLSAVAQGSRTAAAAFKALAGIFTVAPEVSSGGAGISSPLLVATVGGSKLADGFDFAAQVAEILAEGLQISADLSGKLAGYQRREEEWEFERDIADIELEEIRRQIAGAEIQVAIANQEITIHRRTIRQNQEIADFYRSKFSNQALYNWMIARLSGLYFQAYQLAYDMAKYAEKALQFELPTTDTFITPTHWDNLRRGLLAGESLRLQLNRMERFHLEQDSRFLEIEKTLSMRETRLGDGQPLLAALLLLLAEGECEFQLSEQLFNQDFPGHYFRVIKTIELEVRTNRRLQAHEAVNATLIQLNNKTLLDPDINGALYLMGESTEIPSSVRVNWRANQQIAVSKINDRDDGMFTLNFFLDDRYFPFEGTGLTSAWRLEIPKANNGALLNEAGNALDIEDVLIHLRYTAKPDRGQFRAQVQQL